MPLALVLTLLASSPAAAPQDATAPADDRVTIAADRLHVGNGTVLERALVVVEDGRIRAVQEGVEPPAGALHFAGAELTPGLVDSFSFMGVDGDSVEEQTEVTPSLSLASLADLDSEAFRRAAEAGVTTAFLSPDSVEVIGGLGAVVKTAGGTPGDLFAPPGSAARVLLADAALKITVAADPGSGNRPPRGSPPFNLRYRRPTTRMGTVWLIRQAFYEALAYREARAAGVAGEDADLEVLVAALEGRLPIRVQARRSHDIQTALRLQQEFGWPRMIVEEGTEAHLAAPLLARARVPVCFGPAYDVVSRAIARPRAFTLAQWREACDPAPICCEDPRHLHLPEAYRIADEPLPPRLTGIAADLLAAALPRYDLEAAAGVLRGRPREGDHATPATPALLEEAGVSFALGAAEGHDVPVSEASVIQQARIAVAYGLDPERALQAATLDAATLCGVADRVGSVAAGKDADLVLWSGPPLEWTSRPILVLVDGRVLSSPAASRP